MVKINYKIFRGAGITNSTIKAVDWIEENYNDIKIISLFEFRFLFHHGGMMIIYRNIKKEKR